MQMPSHTVRKPINIAKILKHVFIAAVCFIIIFPLFWMISTSFKTPAELFTEDLRLIPNNPSFINYKTGIHLDTQFVTHRGWYHLRTPVDKRSRWIQFCLFQVSRKDRIVLYGGMVAEYPVHDHHDSQLHHHLQNGISEFPPRGDPAEPRVCFWHILPPAAHPLSTNRVVRCLLYRWSEFLADIVAGDRACDKRLAHCSGCVDRNRSVEYFLLAAAGTY